MRISDRASRKLNPGRRVPSPTTTRRRRSRPRRSEVRPRVGEPDFRNPGPCARCRHARHSRRLHPLHAVPGSFRTCARHRRYYGQFIRRVRLGRERHLLLRGKQALYNRSWPFEPGDEVLIPRAHYAEYPAWWSGHGVPSSCPRTRQRFSGQRARPGVRVHPRTSVHSTNRPPTPPAATIPKRPWTKSPAGPAPRPYSSFRRVYDAWCTSRQEPAPCRPCAGATRESIPCGALSRASADGRRVGWTLAHPDL
jgi:hypothetical protein